MMCFEVKDISKNNIWSICDLNIDYKSVYKLNSVTFQADFARFVNILSLRSINKQLALDSAASETSCALGSLNEFKDESFNFGEFIAFKD